MSIDPTRYVEVSANGTPNDPQAAADLAAATAAGALAGDIAGRAAGAEAGAQAGTEVAAAAGAAAGATAGEIAGAAAGTASGSTAGAVAGAAAGGPAGAAAATALLATRTITGGGLATGGGTLAADRVITVTAASQVEAETGTATNVAMTPQRWVNAFEFRTTAYTRGLLASADDAAFRNAIGVPEFQDDASLTAAFVLASVQMMTLAGTPYVRTSLVDILAAGYTAAAYKRSADRFLPNGTTNATNGGYWLNAARQLRPEQFGLFTNRTVTTATLADANDFAVRTGRPIHKRGTYFVNGPCIPDILYATGSYNLVLEDEVVLDVDGDVAAPHFGSVIGVETTAPASHSVTGASLTILARDKAARGVWFRHYGGRGGNLFLTAPIKSRNVCGRVGELDLVTGVGGYGRFIDIICNSPDTEEATRLNAGGETSGWIFSGFEGLASIYTPRSKNIRIGAGAADADGGKCFGHQPGLDPLRRMGSARIYGPVFENCQGRSYKDQTSGDTILYGPLFKRDGHVMTSIDNAHEVDFQMGGGLVLDAQCEYYEGAAIPMSQPGYIAFGDPGYPAHYSPCGPSFSVFAFQQLQSDHVMYGAARNTVIRSEVPFPRVLAALDGEFALNAVTDLDGVELVPMGRLIAGTFVTGKSMITDAVFKGSMTFVKVKPGTTTWRVRDIVGPNDWPIIGYDGFDDALDDVSDKLIVDIQRADNPLGPFPGSDYRAGGFRNLSGDVVQRLKSFRQQDLNGYCGTYAGPFYLDFTALAVGSEFTVDIAAYVATPAAAVNPPTSWGTSGYAQVRCLGQWFGNTDKIVEVQKENGTVYRTFNGGVAWT